MDKHICRAKRIDNGEWIEGYFVGEAFDQGYMVRQIKNIAGWKTYPIDIDTVCRFTGKEDKHGNPIFENDICKVDVPYGPFDENGGYEFHPQMTICEFDQFSASFMCVGEYGDMYRWYGTGMYSNVKDNLVDVIGNKFNNTELMEEQ